MPNIFCPNPPSLCDDEALPRANYSSEAPDAEAFYGRAYGTGMNPPLGSRWTASGCIGLCTSFVSQKEADLCAARQAVICRSFVWPVLEPNPNPNQPDQPFIPVQRQTFGNDPQECSFTCPDGSQFTSEIPADTVIAFSQEAADASAQSLACNEAIAEHICLGELTPPGACADSNYEGEIEISGATGPYAITITSGELPSGIAIGNDENTIFVSGTPTIPGSYEFTLRATDAEGNFNERTFTLSVVSIVQGSLADAKFGQTYSQSLTASGAVGAVTWSLTGGSLPTGLTLASNGTVSGTPAADGAFLFTATVTDENGTACSKGIHLFVDGSCSGIELDSAWTFNPVGSSPGETYEFEFEGYEGEYSFSFPSQLVNASIKEHRLDWTAPASGQVRITARCTGNVDMTGIGAGSVTVNIRSNSNGTFTDDSQLCPNGVNTAVNLEASAISNVAANNFVMFTLSTNTRAPQSLSGTVTVECVP